MSELHKGHRQRVKEEFIAHGLKHFPDHKVLEMLLYYTVPQGDTNETAHLLLERFGSLSSVFDADYPLLQETKGVGPQTATLIKFISCATRRYMEDYNKRHDVLDSAEACKEYMRYKFVGLTAEQLILVCLGHNDRVVFCDCVVEGTPETVHLRPSDVVRAALRANAVKAVLAHNHPNGFCNPSAKDLHATGILWDELRRVNVELVDHIIVAPDGICSMLEKGMLPGKGR